MLLLQTFQIVGDVLSIRLFLIRIRKLRRNIGIVRKSIVAKRDISEGEILSEENITTKRPGTGISPMMWEKVIGQRARKNYKADEMIEL